MATASKTFNREERYLVFKRKDMAKYLSKEGQGQLLYFADKIARERRLDGRVEMNCVVVEHDWPEAEAVWSMIEARMTGGVNFVDWQAAQIISLQRRVEELQKRLGETEEHTHAE